MVVAPTNDPAMSVLSAVSSALIIAHVDYNAAVIGNHHVGILVLKAPERDSLLLRSRLRIKGVNLDNVSSPVGLVGMLGDVKAFVDASPAIAPVGQVDSTTLHGLRTAELQVRRGKVAIEVLLAG